MVKRSMWLVGLSLLVLLAAGCTPGGEKAGEATPPATDKPAEEAGGSGAAEGEEKPAEEAPSGGGLQLGGG